MADYTLTKNPYPSIVWGAIVAVPDSSVGHASGVYDSALGHTPVVTAVPTLPYGFAYWTGAFTGVVNPQTQHMGANVTVNAWFYVDFNIPVDASPSSVSGSFTPLTPNKSVVALASSVRSSGVGIDPANIQGAILKDASPLTYINYTAQANDDTANDVNLLPAAPQTSDSFLFGVSDIDFDVLRYVIDIGTAGAGTWTLNYNYWNGAFVALPAKNILHKSDQFFNFRTVGLGSLWVVPPSDWVTVAISGVTSYWIEARVTFSSKTVTPLGTRVWGGGGSAVSFHRLVNYVRTKTLIGR